MAYVTLRDWFKTFGFYMLDLTMMRMMGKQLKFRLHSFLMDSNILHTCIASICMHQMINSFILFSAVHKLVEPSVLQIGCCSEQFIIVTHDHDDSFFMN